MFKKKFIFACALLLQGSGFCVLPEAFVPVELASTDAGFKYSYCRVSALTQPVDQTILVSRTDYAFLIKQFQAPQSAGVVNASKLRFIRQFVMAVKKRQSTQILLRCPFDEKMSFIVQLRFGVKAPGAKKTSTDVTIYGLWPTIPQQIFEFVKTSVEQKTVWSITQKVVAVGTACGGALGVGALVNNVRDARLQREKKAAQDLENEKALHKKTCFSGSCYQHYGILKCDGHDETDPALAAHNKKARETAKNEQNHRDFCRNNLCYRFGELTCDGWGELNEALWAQRAEAREAERVRLARMDHFNQCRSNCQGFGGLRCNGWGELNEALWPQRAEARERAAAAEAARVERLRAHNQGLHEHFCRDGICRRHGDFECDGHGETDPVVAEQNAEQRRLAEVARIERERVAAIERDRERAVVEARRRVEAEMAQRVPRLAQDLEAQFAENKNVFITHTKLVAADKISCFVYDLSHFHLNLLQGGDIRILVVGVSDLSKAGDNPVARQGVKTVAQVLTENAQDFKDRGWKIIIVNDVHEAAFHADLVAEINRAFSVCGAAVVSLADLVAQVNEAFSVCGVEVVSLADLVGRIRGFVFDSSVHLRVERSAVDCSQACDERAPFCVPGNCTCPLKIYFACQVCLDDWKARKNTCPLCASADFSIVQIRKDPAGA